MAALFLGLIAFITPDFSKPIQAYEPSAAALNYALFRQAVHQYVFSGHKTAGPIPAGSLQMPSGWITMRPWNAQIASGFLYVWGVASPDEIEATRELFWESYAIGRASGGLLVPNYGGTTSIPSFVPDGNLVSVVGIGS